MFLGLIPARYASTRFPGKPLVRLHGKSMIEWVYLRASRAFSKVVVATDDERIANEVKRFGGYFVMTSNEHQSGTDRCAEALSIVQQDTDQTIDVVINIQGDEPFVDPSLLIRLGECFNNPDTDIATVVRPIDNTEDLFNPNCVKAVLSLSGRAIYFSRSPIPYIRGKEQNSWHSQFTFLKHLGLYAYRSDVLRQLTRLPQSSLEKAESLEQNRWLENDYRIQVITTNFETIAIDTPEDLEKARQLSADYYKL